MENKLTYVDSLHGNLIRVYLGGKRIGTIAPVTGEKVGFCYVPMGSPKHRGETMPTIKQVMRSLEG